MYGIYLPTFTIKIRSMYGIPDPFFPTPRKRLLPRPASAGRRVLPAELGISGRRVGELRGGDERH